MKANPKIITQQTGIEALTATILADKRNFLVSESVEEQLVLMQKVRNYFVLYGSRSRVVKELVDKENLTQSAAWKLVDITPQLYATYIQGLSRDFHVDIHLQKIEQTYRMAEAAGDFKTMASCDKNRQEAIKEFCGTKELIDQTKLHLPDIEIGFHPELFKDIPDVNSTDFEKIINNFRKRKELKTRSEEDYTDYQDVEK